MMRKFRHWFTKDESGLYVFLNDLEEATATGFVVFCLVVPFIISIIALVTLIIFCFINPLVFLPIFLGVMWFAIAIIIDSVKEVREGKNE